MTTIKKNRSKFRNLQIFENQKNVLPQNRIKLLSKFRNRCLKKLHDLLQKKSLKSQNLKIYEKSKFYLISKQELQKIARSFTKKICSKSKKFASF